MALALLLATTLNYTIPVWEATGCDSLVVVCDSLGACQEIRSPERMGAVEVWWGVRYGEFRLLRVKDVVGREGERDTLEVPSDTLASVYLVAVDLAGNKSCASRTITVNGRVGVEEGQPKPLPVGLWYDIAGRRIPKPTTPGVYFHSLPGVWRKKIVILK